MIKLPAIVLGLMLLLTGTTQKVMAQDEDVSMQSFYDELSPYGTWIQDPQYGYVWRPDVEQGEFRPYYSNGRWAMTEYGNTWVSDYDWGWAPFHYGRWVYNRYSQWVWIPDTVWGPAWVSWRSGGGYYGWAPMGPGMNVNVNINIPDLWWVFVPQRNIYYNSFPRYYSRRNVVIINNTTIINNTYVRNNRYYSSGPRANDIRRYTGRDVPVYSVNRTARPSRTNFDGNRINMYSPSRSRAGNTGVTGPRESVRGEGYATARPDRSSQDGRQGNGYDRQVRGDDRITANREPVGNRPDRNIQQAQPQRDQQQRDERAATARPERVGRQDQAQPQVRPDQGQRAAQVDQQVQAERQPQTDRQVQARQEQPRQQQAQPQRMERRPEVQQAPQRMERSAPSRSSGNEGRGSTSSGRSSRGGRG
ncbi:DUF6600 domain-containing protein [Pedobacter sp. PWIIR3]